MFVSYLSIHTIQSPVGLILQTALKKASGSVHRSDWVCSVSWECRIFERECDLSCDWWCCVYSDARDIHYRLRCVLLLPEHVPSARDLHLCRLPLNPIGLEPGWRKLRREIDWLNPLIIRISQRGPADSAFGSRLSNRDGNVWPSRQTTLYSLKFIINFKWNLRFYLRWGICGRFHNIDRKQRRNTWEWAGVF